MRNESLDHLIKLSEGTEKPVLTPNSNTPLFKEELAAMVRNATTIVVSQAKRIHSNFQQHCCQHQTDCRVYYCKSHRSSYPMRGRYI